MLSIGSFAVLASAQEAPLVDRAVGDLDPLATSTRYLDPAYNLGPNRFQLYELQPNDPTTGTRSLYRYEGPGFRATFDRPDYLTLTDQGVALNQAASRDGAFVNLIPPNTVFDLTPPAPVVEGAPPTPEMLRWRVDTRMADGYRVPTPRHDGQPLSAWGAAAPAWPVVDDPGTLARDVVGEPPTLQPWVTAEDLREHEAEVPVVTDRVVLPGESGTVTPEPPVAAEAESEDSEPREAESSADSAE